MFENENQEESIVETIVDNSIEEINEEILEDESSKNAEEEAIKTKKLKKNYLKIFIQLILSSLVYLIASSCDKFKGLSSSNDVQNMVVLEYAKYIMYFTYFLTIIAVIIFIIRLCKKEINIKINLEKLYNALDWVILFPMCIALATFCFSFLFTFTTVSGDSMNPNILENQRLFVTYPSSYERFDVVVIKVDPSYKSVAVNDLYLKRIIGLPGDYIDYRLENGITQLYVNGEKVKEYFYTEEELKTYLTYNTSSSRTPFDWGEKCFIDGGNSPEKKCEQVGGYYIIPEGYYFVLGDNRLVSKDSRNIGLIKEKDIIGVTKYIVSNIFKPVKIN